MKWKKMTPFIVTDESKPGDMKVIAVTANKTMYSLNWACEAASEEDAANARLIAAAPDLLGACKGAIAALAQNKTYPADIDAAKSFLSGAIAKAEGRE